MLPLARHSGRPTENLSSHRQNTAFASTSERSRSERANLAWCAPLTADEIRDALIESADAIATSDIAPVLRSLDLAELSSAFGRRLFERWAEAEAGSATVWACEHADRTMRDQLLQNAASHWAETDLAAALAWLDLLPADHESKGWLCAIIGAKATDSRPLTALRLALELPDESIHRLSLARSAVVSWASVDPHAASAWLLKLPADPLRDGLTQALISSWAEIDGATALVFALENLVPGHAQESAIEIIIQREGARMGEIADRLPADLLRNTSLSALFALWAAGDAPTAFRWLNNLEPGPLRDRTVATYAMVLAGRGTEPETAMWWARNIADTRLREQCVERVASQFR